MIKRNSPEWKDFIERLNLIKTKSNREVLCIKCWQMLNCKQKIKHLKQYENHKTYLLTSTQYASEQKICELAQGYNKLIKKNDGFEYMISPFAPVNLNLLNETNFKNQSFIVGSGMESQDQNPTYNKYPRQLHSQQILGPHYDCHYMRSQEINRQHQGSPNNSDQRSKKSLCSDNKDANRSLAKPHKCVSDSCKTPQHANESSRDSKKRINPDNDSPMREGPNKRLKISHNEKNTEYGGIQKDFVDQEKLGRNYVPITEFKLVVEELALIKTNFAEVSKKLDAVMKIQDFILNQIPLTKSEQSQKSVEGGSPDLRMRMNQQKQSNQNITQSPLLAQMLSNNQLQKLITQQQNKAVMSQHTNQQQLLQQMQLSQQLKLINQNSSVGHNINQNVQTPQSMRYGNQLTNSMNLQAAPERSQTIGLRDIHMLLTPQLNHSNPPQNNNGFNVPSTNTGSLQ